MEWIDSHKNPPKHDQKVYYFGPNIGIGIGYYKLEKQFINRTEGIVGNRINESDIELCPHIFHNTKFGVVDACDAPFWYPYDEERAKSWCPIIPEKYTKDLYDRKIAP